MSPTRIFILLTSTIAVVIKHVHVFSIKEETVWILIRADEDLQCFLKRINPGSAGQGLTDLRTLKIFI